MGVDVEVIDEGGDDDHNADDDGGAADCHADLFPYCDRQRNACRASGFNSLIALGDGRRPNGYAALESTRPAWSYRR